VFVAGKTRIANGSDRRQRSNSPSCLASSQVVGNHAAGVVLPKLVPAASSSPSGVAAVRKSACLGGQSLATSAAKRLLARPACRGGRMMPERPAQGGSAKKKPRPKHVAPKVVTDENVANGKCVCEQKSQLHQPTPASSTPNDSVPIVPADARPTVTKDVQSALLPRIVIKFHQGKIVSPTATVAASASAVGIKKQTAEHRSNGAVDIQERKSSGSGAEKSDRMKARPPSKPVKAAVGCSSHTKTAGQSTTSKVLADKNSGITCFDSSQLQESGSFDKLSLDCCMKLYSQLRDQRKTGEPSQSLPESKSSKQTSKHRRTSPSDRAVHAATESRKRSHDRTQQWSSVSEPLTKVQAGGGSGDVAKFSASCPPSCRVELNRVSSSTDTRTSFHKLSNDGICDTKGKVSDKSVCAEERRLDDGLCNFGAVGSDGVTLSDVSVQQNGVPTATETVPGLSVPLSKPSRSFSKKSHTPAESDSAMLSSPHKFCAAETNMHVDYSEKTQSDLLSDVLNHSTNDQCPISAAKKSNTLSSAISSVNSQSTAYAAAVADKLSEELEVSTTAVDCIIAKNSNVRHTKNGACEVDSRSLEASVGRKRFSSTAYDASVSDAISRPACAKQSRLSSLPCDQLTVPPLASSVLDETPNGNPVSALPSPTSAINAGVEVCETPHLTELTSDSEPPSTEFGWTSPNCSPDNCPSTEASTSPLRLRIRRLPNVSPVREVYNIIGQDAGCDSTPNMP